MLEDGGDENQAIAALLHDAVEDGGGRPMLDRIRAQFGTEVAAIVQACSDSLEADDTRSWRERKAIYCRALLHVFSARQTGPLVEDLRHALSELEELAAADTAATETRRSVA